METIGDRIKAILARLDINASELSRRAGLSRAHVGKIIARSANPNAGFEHDTMVAIAKAGGVSLDWLMTGKADETTPPLVQTSIRVEHTERYAGRAEAARAMEGLVEPEAISSVGQWDLNATQDPGALWWIERIKEADRQLKLWRKSPAAERAELEKRAADTDALEAEYERRVKASKVAQAPVNDAAPPLPNDGAKRARKPKQ